MKGNLYDWMRMSESHRQYAAKNYPVASRLGLGSEDYDTYADKVRALQGATKDAFMSEFQHWFCEFGSAWNQLGAIQEYSVGEHTKSIQMGPRRNRFPSVRPAGFRGLAPTALSCFSGYEDGQSIWYNTPDDIGTGTSDPYQDDWSIGTPSSTPKLPSGYFWGNPPSGIRKTSLPKAISGYPGWTKTTWAGADNQLYYQYYHQNSNTEKWARPKSNVVSWQMKKDIKSIQAALNKAGYSAGTADGIIGPKTCGAAYSFKIKELRDNNVMLDEKFYAALGLGGKNFSESYGRICAMYYKDVPVIPDPDPDPPKVTPGKKPPKETPPTPPPVIEKAGFPWWMGAIIGVGALGAVISMDPKKSKKRGRK